SRNGKPCAFPNLRSVLFRNLAKLCHRFAGEDFNFQPDLKFSLIRPDPAHLRPGITVDHARNIRRLDSWKSVFVLGCADLRVSANDCKAAACAAFITKNLLQPTLSEKTRTRALEAGGDQ